jgi:TRAP-type C4-dicarboxylate transport system permease large subunit
VRVVASGACTGILIPPSIAYIIVGLVLGISSTSLFVAAVIPGLMILLAVIVTNIIINHLRSYENSYGRFVFRTWLRALNDAKWALMVPLIILGGIYSGVFTPTESGWRFAVAVAIIVGLAQKRLALRDFPAMLATSARVNGVILPIIAVALLFAQALTAVAYRSYLSKR